MYIISAQQLKELRQVLEVILLCATSDEQIIHINEHKIKSQDNLIDKPSESTCQGPQAKRYTWDHKRTQKSTDDSPWDSSVSDDML